MSINLNQLKEILKSTPYPLFRDQAKKNQAYPYLVYSFVSEDNKKASSKLYRSLPYYQVSLFTEGTEKDLKMIKEKLNDHQVPFKTFGSVHYKENDKQITNFYTYVRCVDNG